MTQLPDSPANYCYRHPDRQSFVLCQRCGRTICPECQSPAAVGVHCPECMRESRQSAPRVQPRVVTAVRRAGRSGSPVVTYAIMALCVLVFLAELATGLLGPGGGIVENLLGYHPGLTLIAPWQMITTIFVHGGFLHILFNLFSLYVLGRQLEPMVGRARFAALFLLSGIGGSVAVLLLSPGTFVVGASGAIFGLFAAYFVIARHLGANGTQLIVIIGINLAAGFFLPNIAWQAHLGGLIVGAMVGLIYVKTRSVRRRTAQYLLLAGVFALLVALVAVGVSYYGITA